MTDWTTVKLKHLAKIRVSNVDKVPVDTDRRVRLCNYTDVYYNERLTNDMPYMTSTATVDQVRAFSLQQGDVVLTKDSETADDIAVAARVEEQLDNVVCGYHLALVRPLPHRVEPRYLYWSLRSAAARESFSAGATGVTRFGLRSDVIGGRTLCLPDPFTQRAIADVLDAETARLDALIDKRALTLARFAARRQAACFAGVSGLLTTRGEPQVATSLSWLPAMPESWSTALLKLVAKLGSGHTPSRNHPEWWVPAECVLPWITTGEVAQIRLDRVEVITETRERISTVGLASSAAELHPAGTVVLSRTASVGFSAVMGTAMATSQDFATWTCGPLLRPHFLLLCLRAMRSDLVGRLAIGSTHKTIYMPDIESIRVPVPPLTEQDRIVEAVRGRLSAIDRASDAIGRQIRLLRERRQALITAAVTGEIDVSRGAA